MGDSDFSKMVCQTLPPNVQEVLDGLPLVQQEQYLDFSRNESFRKTILCHAEVTLDRQIDAHRVKPLHIALKRKPDQPETQEDAGGKRQFRFGQTRISCDDALAVAAIEHLGQIWPRTITCTQLFKAAQRQCDREPDHRQPGKKRSPSSS